MKPQDREVVIGADPDAGKYENRPEMSPELENRKMRRRLWRQKRAAFVAEGAFICRRLRYNSQYRDIPDGSSAITSLAAGPTGAVFGATSGETVHVFAYNPTPPFDAVATLAVLEGETDCRRSLVAVGEGAVICGTRATGDRPEGWPGGALYQISGFPFFADAVQEWPRGFGEVEKLGVPVEGEGIAALAFDALRNRVYGLSDKTGVFFVHDVASRRTEQRGSVDPLWHYSENLMIAPDGLVLTTGPGSTLVRYDPETDRLETLDAAVPHFPGRGLYARIDSWTWEPVRGLFYVGDQADGLLYTVDPRTLEARLLGKPTDRVRVRALAAAADGRVFGMAGQPGDMAQMFVYEPDTAQLRNLGIPLAAVEERRYGYEFDAAAAGPQGQLYFGESERSSRLFVYFPSYAGGAAAPKAAAGGDS